LEDAKFPAEIVKCGAADTRIFMLTEDCLVKGIAAAAERLTSGVTSAQTRSYPTQKG
jgi:hypothetical protein